MTADQFLQSIVAWVQQEPGLSLLIAAGAYLLLFILLITVLIRQSKIGRKQARLLRGTDGESLERMLLEHVDGAQAVREQITRAQEAGTANAQALKECLQRVGLVRYNAFNDVGGDQSFSLALLDGDSNGLVISGLYSRNDMRVYAKPIAAGESPLVLSSEERQAIASARPGDAAARATAENSERIASGGMGRAKARNGS